MFDYLTGVYNITPTPFHPDGSLDEASLKRLTAFTRDKGVHGMWRCEKRFTSGAAASARVRSPFTPVDADTLSDLDRIMRRLGLS